MMNFSKCYVCGIEYEKGLDTGIRTSIISCEEKQNRITKRWHVVERKQKIFICDKCVGIANGIIRNYRKNSR